MRKSKCGYCGHRFDVFERVYKLKVKDMTRLEYGSMYKKTMCRECYVKVVHALEGLKGGE